MSPQPLFDQGDWSSDRDDYFAWIPKFYLGEKELPPMYDGPPVAPEDVWDIYVILNGSLDMSPGKASAQSFHCGWLAGVFPSTSDNQWLQQGRRVSVRIAETTHIFQRVCDECEGITQRDEGLTEVEHGSATAFVTIPYRRADAPKILSHKKLQSY